MPLVRFEVRNEYSLGAQELYTEEVKDEEPKALLEGVTVAGLVGILRQLGDLSEFAAEVFHGLQEQVVATSSRSHNMLVRVQHIEAKIPPLEKAVLAQTSHIHFAYTAGCDWHPKIRMKQKHLIRSDLPSFIMNSYEECPDPPRLHLLDRFDTGGPGACLRRYSDPSYFRKAVTRSEPLKAEKVQREKKVRKSKKKASWRRNGEVSNAVSISECNGRMLFESPNSYGQSSAAETISTIHMISKSELGDQSMSFDSRTRSGYIECVFDGSSSMQQEDQDHNGLSTSSSKMDQAGAYDNLTHGSSRDFNSSSVTWVEKTEIVGPKNHQPNNIVGDEDVNPEFLRERSDLAKLESRAATDRHIDPEDIMYIDADILEPLSECNQFDEVGSEAEKYMDALNTLESETETDSECQTKREVENPSSTFINEGMEPGETHDVIAQNSELSKDEFGTTSLSLSDKQQSQNCSNLVSSEDLVHAQPPDITGIPSDPDILVDIDLPESTHLLDVLRVDGSESAIGDPSSSSSIVPDAQAPSYDKIIGTQCESQGSLPESDASSVNVWTNGGLLGLEPSKPPDYNVPNIESHKSVAVAKDDVNGLSSNSNMPNSHPNGWIRKLDSLVTTPEQREKNPKSLVGRERSPKIVSTTVLHSDQLLSGTGNMVREIYDSECLTSYHDKQGTDITKENSLDLLSIVSEAGLGKPKDSSQNWRSNADKCDSTKTGPLTSQSEVPVISSVKCPSSEGSQENIERSSSMFGLSQRLHGNGFLRKGSDVRDDTPEPLGYVKTGLTRLNQPHWIHQIGKGNFMHHLSPEWNPKEQPENGSPLDSLPSSPPLEHMKISFHPINGFETSKLRLKYPGGHHFHESLKDVIFPSFQLLPHPEILLQDFDSESDNDTFCRSSPTLSEELMSQNSDSSSEQWESGETLGSKDHEIYDALRRVSSVESILSAFELEGIANGSIHFDNSLKSPDPDSGLKTFQYDPVFDLPSFDTVSSLASQPKRKCDSNIKDHQDLVSQYPNDPMPHPPLPLVEWHAMKLHSDVAENDQDFSSKVANYPDGVQVLEAAHSQQTTPDPPKHLHTKEITDCLLKSKQDQQKSENGKDMDEREDFLNQIRTKSFSLRRTSPARSTATGPTTNTKVAAIIAKANAIRQAYVGSDEGADDESWSDG